MTFYRLLRYFFILFCAGSVFLYISRNSFSPFPSLSQTFQKFDDYYRGLDKTYNAEGNAEEIERILRSEADRLISPEKNTLDRFLDDEKTRASLNTFGIGFDSLETLVRQYFVSDETFEDLVITRQGALLYRYENIPVNQAFGITRNISADSGALTVKVLYSPDYFLSRVPRSEFPIVFKWEADNTYSETLQIRTFDRSILKTETELLPPGFEIVQQKDREILYRYKPEAPYIQGPVFYFIETLPAPQRLSHKALFIAGILITLLLIFILDRQILRILRDKNQKQMRKKLFPSFNRPTEPEDSMDWLDKLAASEFAEKNTGQSKGTPPRKENGESEMGKELPFPPNKEDGNDI